MPENSSDKSGSASTNNGDYPKLLELYKQSIETRKLELGLFWQRSLFFWGFIAATFIAYVALLDQKSPLMILIAGFGIVSSLVWYLANRGSKWWHENWETKAIQLEKELGFSLFSKFEQPRMKPPRLVSSLNYSVTKLTIGLSLFVFCIWIFIFLYSLAIQLIPAGSFLNTALIILGVLFAAVFVYFIGLILRSRISPEKEKFVNGKRLKLLRKEKKYSAKHMADLLGINRRDYRYIEKGFYVKDIAHIDKIKDILGVSANELKKT